MIPAPTKIGRRAYTYEEWYGMYYDEINEILECLIECVMEGLCSQHNVKAEKMIETSHSLNVQAFSEQLKRRLYQTSDNRFKDTNGIWE
jgi:hypothetical protein